ncbi:MAG: aldehyde dehydrogenase family protein [Flavobacteriales bacterium]
MESQDVVTFTGSASTGRMLKAHLRIIAESVPFNMEADSLNSIVLGPDATPDTEGVHPLHQGGGREMTLKCGQRCTGARRIMRLENLQTCASPVASAWAAPAIGDPRAEGVRMGAPAGQTQRQEVRDNLAELLKGSELVYEDPRKRRGHRFRREEGRLHEPILLLNKDPGRTGRAETRPSVR